MKDEKISIVFFLLFLGGGGTERVVVNIVNNLDRQKYNVSLVLAEAKGGFLDRIKKDVPIIDLNVSGDLKLFFRLIKYFRNEKIDIFVSTFSRINMICILAKIFSGKSTKIIITQYSVLSLALVTAETAKRRFFARFFLPTLAKIIYPKADKIICASNGVADDLSNIIGCKEKLKVIYHPVISNNTYELSEDPLDISSFCGANESLVISVGRLTRCKDYPNLLKAFSLVVKEKSAQLIILGGGLEEKNLVQLTNELGLSKKVTFLGFQENPFKYMKKASVFVLSSITEGLGNVIPEAMACGVPVISTNCKFGPNEIIENGKNGLLVSVGDPKSLAEGIIKLLKNCSLREKFSREGKRCAKDFTVDKKIKEYEKVFLDVIKK